MLMKYSARHRVIRGVVLLSMLSFAYGASAQQAQQAQQAHQAQQTQQTRQAQQTQQTHRVSIPFADIGNVRNWRADGTSALFIQAMNRKWYRATFWAPCQELPFAIAIAFVTEPNGQLDRYSSILVEGDRCWFRSFGEASPPPSEAGP
jgi:hypothetical protein